MLRHFSRNRFFKIFNLGNISENFDQKVQKKCQKSDFLAKNQVFFKFFWSTLSNILPNSKNWNKPFLELCLNMIFKQF